MRRHGEILNTLFSLTAKVISCAMLFTLSLFASCSFFDDPAPIGNPNLIWKIPVAGGNDANANLANVQLNQGVLFQERVGDKNYLTFIDKENGSSIWTWSDFFLNDGYRYQSYQNNKTLLIATLTARYCIDLTSGLTLWKESISTKASPPPIISGYLDSFGEGGLYYDRTDSLTAWKILKGNLLSGGQMTEIVTQKYKYYGYNYFELLPIGDSEGVLLSFGERQKAYNFNNDCYLSLYNYSKKEWVYHRKLIHQNGSAWTFVLQDAKKIFLFAGNIIYCQDLYTGASLWSIKSDSKIAALNGTAGEKIIFTTEDSFTHGIEINTGVQLWQTKTATSTRRLGELNGVIYFVAGTYRMPAAPIINLLAIDAANGNILWRFKSADGDDFQNGVHIVPGTNGQKGKIIVSSYRNAFCYEALR
jgi:outer membrane protein assembly factor BamB